MSVKDIAEACEKELEWFLAQCAFKGVHSVVVVYYAGYGELGRTQASAATKTDKTLNEIVTDAAQYLQNEAQYLQSEAASGI